MSEFAKNGKESIGAVIDAKGKRLTPGPVSYTHLTLPTTERV